MDILSHHEKVKRPWGEFEQFTLNEQTTVKIHTIAAGEAWSLQTHENRDEFWRVLKGSGTIRIGEAEREAHEGDSFSCPRHTAHRVTGGTGGIMLLEIAFGEFDEEDIKRLADRYHRA
ncbi:phosphomannose isomerase type II C-terminal cupin domain [Candidatus Kaiserbacteria bacterium]|nr:phosphomannose isomerase type II C-terminal cupin domain [Candidatus Kaiserbacteria bacterium]